MYTMYNMTKNECLPHGYRFCAAHFISSAANAVRVLSPAKLLALAV